MRLRALKGRTLAFELIVFLVALLALVISLFVAGASDAAACWAWL